MSPQQFRAPGDSLNSGEESGNFFCKNNVKFCFMSIRAVFLLFTNICPLSESLPGICRHSIKFYTEPTVCRYPLTCSAWYNSHMWLFKCKLNKNVIPWSHFKSLYLVSAQQWHGARGHCIGQSRYTIFPSLLKVPLDSTGLDPLQTPFQLILQKLLETRSSVYIADEEMEVQKVFLKSCNWGLNTDLSDTKMCGLLLKKCLRKIDSIWIVLFWAMEGENLNPKELSDFIVGWANGKAKNRIQEESPAIETRSLGEACRF